MVTACPQSIDMETLMPIPRGGLRDRRLNVVQTKKIGVIKVFNPFPPRSPDLRCF